MRYICWICLTKDFNIYIFRIKLRRLEKKELSRPFFNIFGLFNPCRNFYFCVYRRKRHVQYFYTFVPVRTCTTSRSRFPHSRCPYLPPPGSCPLLVRLSTKFVRQTRRPPADTRPPSWAFRSCNRARNSPAKSTASSLKVPSPSTALSFPLVHDL